MRVNKTYFFCSIGSVTLHIMFLLVIGTFYLAKDIKLTEKISNLELSLEIENPFSSDAGYFDRESKGAGINISEVKNNGNNVNKNGDGNGKGNGNKNSGTSVIRPVYSYNPKPDYPVFAKKSGYEGIVNLKVRVLENGLVGEVLILGSSGYSILDEAAKKTVKTWKFLPASKNGEPFACWVNIPIKFKLE